MKIILFGILLCVAITANCESLTTLNIDNVPEGGAVYQLGSMSLMSYRNGLKTFDSKGACCCTTPGSGSCTFNGSDTCTSATGVCKCCN